MQSIPNLTISDKALLIRDSERELDEQVKNSSITQAQKEVKLEELRMLIINSPIFGEF